MLFEYYILYASIYFGLFMASYFLMGFLEAKSKDPELGRFKDNLPFVSIIIPAYNRKDSIARTIKPCLELDYPKDRIEIIVVDDGSEDCTYEEALKIKDPRVRVFKKKNGGKGSALNFGIKKARGEFIASLDADSFVSKYALKKMLGYFNDDKVMSVTPALQIYKPKGYWLKLQYAEYAMSIFLRKTFGIIDAIHVVPGPFSIYRASFFKKYGGFDENNITEDTEMGLRIQHHHYKIKNSMEATVLTIAPNNFMALMKQRMRWYYGFTKNAIKYKHLFSTKYGDLGICVLPAAFLSVLFTLVLFGYFIYKNMQLIFDSISKMLVLNTKIVDAIIHSKPIYIREFFISMLVNPFIAFTILSAIILAVYVFVAKSKTKEKGNMFSAYIYFLLTYWIIYPLWWLAVLFYKGILRKKLRWGKKTF